MARFRVIAPQCPSDHTWYDEATSRAVKKLLKQLRATSIVDPSRIYLTGWSLGGFGVYSVLQRSDIPAAAAIVSGGRPRDQSTPRGAWPPLWVAYGRNYSTVRAQLSEDLVRLVRAAGGTVRISEFGDADGGKPSAHVLACQNAFADPALYDWLLLHQQPAA